MGSFRRVAGTFLVLLLGSATTTTTAQAQYVQQPQFSQQPQYTSQPNCGPCPPGFRPAFGGGAGSGTVYKATLILEECPPCPPGYIPTTSNSIQPFGFSPQQGYGAGNNNYGLQQPALGPTYQQQNHGQYGAATNYQQPYGQPQGYYPPANLGYGATTSTAFQPGTLSSAYPPQSPLSFPQGQAGQQVGYPQQPSLNHPQSQLGYGGGVPVQTGFTGPNHQPLFPSSTPLGAGLYPSQTTFNNNNNQYGGFGQQPSLSGSGGFQPPFFGGESIVGAGGGAFPDQPGYLPNFYGDHFTNPQRIQETRALNEPFFQSIGGEPHYPGGEGMLQGGNSAQYGVGRPFSAEKTEKTAAAKKIAKERRRRRK